MTDEYSLRFLVAECKYEMCLGTESSRALREGPRPLVVGVQPFLSEYFLG